MILITRYAKNIRDRIRYFKKRSYRNFDEKAFLEEVVGCKNVDQAVDIFTRILTDILDKMAPIKSFR